MTQFLSTAESTKPPPHERYGFKPFSGSSHSWALSHLLAEDRACRVLDIGTGSGAIGRELRQAGFSDLSGIEIDEQAFAHAQGIYRRMEKSIDPYFDQQFDVILLLDVLEHMTDPKRFLQRACSLLVPSGRILISVPNIAHWSIRLMLLFGKFDYGQRGLLDETHFHFFTRASLRRMIDSMEQLEIHSIKSSIEPLELILPKKIWESSLYQKLSSLRIGLAGLMPGLMSYQHLALATKREAKCSG